MVVDSFIVKVLDFEEVEVLKPSGTSTPSRPQRATGRAVLSPGLSVRSLLQSIINALLSADADAVVGAEWGRPSPVRTTQRNGYRHRDLDTRVGTIDVAVPKLRQGTYFPHWLLEPPSTRSWWFSRGPASRSPGVGKIPAAMTRRWASITV